MRAISPALAWSDESYLLARIDYTLRVIAWMFSKDGADNVNRPEPISTPAEIAAHTAELQSAVAFDESGDFLAQIQPRTQDTEEVADG